ncbi:FtsB family cell division protein [Kordiimonas aquimaris]|uniref:FtsB family cell division protein n=1 Tax=Kordiimonas aquimaris TaxID=707591 RepID=UPI0021D1184B|nr:septum formation initiator family protein [Kordiimonas aquimaris]
MKRIGNIIHGMGRSWQAGFWMLLVAYFAFHAFNGANSISALKNLQVQEQELLALAQAVRTERLMMESRTRAMSGTKVDPDMLEQQVRVRLGFTHPDEVIVITN